MDQACRGVVHQAKASLQPNASWPLAYATQNHNTGPMIHSGADHFWPDLLIANRPSEGQKKELCWHTQRVRPLKTFTNFVSAIIPWRNMTYEMNIFSNWQITVVELYHGCRHQRTKMGAFWGCSVRDSVRFWLASTISISKINYLVCIFLLSCLNHGSEKSGGVFKEIANEQGRSYQ